MSTDQSRFEARITIGKHEGILSGSLQDDDTMRVQLEGFNFDAIRAEERQSLEAAEENAAEETLDRDGKGDKYI